MKFLVYIEVISIEGLQDPWEFWGFKSSGNEFWN